MPRGSEQATARAARARSRGAPRPQVVVTTKFHPPAGRRAHVPRPALVARLASAPAGQLSVVSAPAGWGKTTLLADWYASEQGKRRIAWLSLDGDDNDPVRFLAYMVEALRRAAPELGEAAEAVLRAPGSTFLEVMLPALVNELEALPGSPVALVLEDYHVVVNREIHEAIAYLVERLPRTLALVLVTRSDPPLPLARLRARGELTEVRADELRFSPAETEMLLNEVLDLGLDESQVARLHERTEGWAAGLYLAALSLRGRPDASAFIAAFAGDDRHVVDYLAVEVLDNQPGDVRAFLAHTSILDRLSGPLCDAVVEGSRSARKLEEMERSNLFVVPLDNRRRWYRYHRLFATLLSRELEDTEPDLVPTLHSRAAAWYEAEGSVADVIHHLLAAGNVNRARELIARHWTESFNQGRLETVSRWLDELPRTALLADPQLCAARAWILLDRGEVDEAGRWIGLAAEADEPAAEHSVAILRAVHKFKAGDVSAAHSAARAGLALDWSSDLFGATVANCLAGITSFLLGRAEAAVSTLEDAARLAETAENQLGRMYALGWLALVHAEAGERPEAEVRSAAATLLADDPARSEHFVAMIGELARGRALADRGELGAAQAALRRAVQLSRRGAGRLEEAYARLALAEVVHALGARDDAVELVREARRTLEACADPGVLGEMLARSERRLRSPGGRGPAVASARDELTDREHAVLRLLATDLSRREIASTLYVSLNTVKTHTRAIFRKLGVSTREEARRRARERGLL
jgi:LuxR family transcriptional regulator, maltose regulon positive regulatory protein